MAKVKKTTAKITTTKKGEQMLIETPEKMECELTTQCRCYQVDDEGDEILDKYGNPEIATECYGDCYESALEDFYGNVMVEWLTRNGYSDTDLLRVDGSGMGWTRSSGWTTVEAHEVHKALTINGEYTIHFMLVEKNLYATRYSHDEPTGTAPFTFSLAPTEE